MAAVAVAVQPIIQKCLIEIRRDDLFTEFVGFGTDERDAQTGERGNQRLRDAVGIGGAVGIFGFDLGQRRSDDEQGRVHLYEGYSPQEITFTIRVFGRMGIRAVVLTNAAGGINLSYSQGALVVIRDHINLQGSNPLVGANDDRFGVRFPDMTHAYAKEYRSIAREEAAKLGIPQHEGVYAGLLGPSYETPAEIEYLRRIGADLVGMSTVAEVIAARHMGIKVLAISCVTNMAAGILDQPLSHAEVMETGERVKTTFEALLQAALPRLEDTIKLSS